MEDIAPKLLEQLQEDFHARIRKNKRLQDLLALVNEGKATYIQAEEVAYEIGTALSQAFGNSLSSATLPDGKMYFNIAQRVVQPLLEEDHQLIADVATQVQEALNQKAKLGLKAQTVAVDQDRVYGIVNKISEAENFDEVAWVLGDPVVNFSQAVVDSILRENVNFQGKSGLTPKIIRKAERKCCKWCSNLAGEYRYPGVPADVYRRHERCRCQVDYDPGTGKVQNVHTKQWKTPEDYDKIKARKAFSASGNAAPAAPKDTAVADAINSGIVKDEINRDLQKPHCEPPKEGRSYLYGDVEKAEELYRKLRTTGTPLRDTKGNWTHKERVANDEPVGVWVDRNGNSQETKGAMIVYSKTGSHIYPRKEE